MNSYFYPQKIMSHALKTEFKLKKKKTISKLSKILKFIRAIQKNKK